MWDCFLEKRLEYFDSNNEIVKCGSIFFVSLDIAGTNTMIICKKCKYNLKPICAEVLEKIEKCKCSSLGPFVVCSFCVNLRYSLNFRTTKTCIEEDNFCSFGFEIKKLINYLRDNLLVDQFSIFNILTERIEIRLDNPRYYYVFDLFKYVDIILTS